MSMWRLAVRALYARGAATSHELAADLNLDTFTVTSHVLQDARQLGLVDSPGRGGGVARPWYLTQRGVDWAEGRLRAVPASRRPGQRGQRTRFVATWLSALPRGVRITQPERAAA